MSKDILLVAKRCGEFVRYKQQCTFILHDTTSQITFHQINGCNNQILGNNAMQLITKAGQHKSLRLRRKRTGKYSENVGLQAFPQASKIIQRKLTRKSELVTDRTRNLQFFLGSGSDPDPISLEDADPVWFCWILSNSLLMFVKIFVNMYEVYVRSSGSGSDLDLKI